ncbi:MAG: sigma-54-dependent Fis family transcriptional regulator [Paludibacteraceae bacterium]|nr:sigma-54-dependent Fis family transcriptional regulator [Paludibacteraceae bacterium]
MDLQRVKQQFNIIGNSPLLNRGIEIATQVAITDLSVLIIGESGVGKEHFPKIIHNYSSRKHEPYFAINCGAIPEGTIDSELFGHEKGAFTDARSERKGYFEIADKGTLFLDEVGELPLSTQARLLRVLETGEFIRVGSSKVQKTNVRVVAATNLDIPRAIKEGKFREDLYYRLNEVGLQVPALRERKDDIPLLLRKFARDFADKYQMPAISLTEEANEMAKHYYWRGNVRQLKNVVNQISIIERSREITPDILQHYLPRNEQHTGLVAVSAPATGQYQDTTNIAVLKQIVLSLNNDLLALKKQVEELKTQVDAKPIYIEQGEQIENVTTIAAEKRTQAVIEDITTESVIEEVTPINNAPISINKIADRDRDREAIKDALEATGGNRKAAAALLGISERTLYRKLKEK